MNQHTATFLQIDTPSILVVEDQRDAREMLSEYLTVSGFVVHQAQDGMEAVDLASRVRPRVILMDLMMPRMDGWEATRRLKADARTKDATIIAVSAYLEGNTIRRARSAGCDDFIAKPYDIVELGDLVRSILRTIR
jgi:two-component system cell cycle response regulator DivK